MKILTPLMVRYGCKKDQSNSAREIAYLRQVNADKNAPKRTQVV